MQSAASRRMLSTLAAKLQPQFPLSPSESQQLLALLTTSFRTHLDRAHPLPEARQTPRPARGHGQRNPSPTRLPSSHTSATQHIDSILSNPLFAVKPSRRASESAAVDVLRDPAGWFVDQIATGAATLPKAAMCVGLLDTAQEKTPRLYNGKNIAAVFAEWLRSSGLEESRAFVDLHTSGRDFNSKTMDKLVALLLAHGEAAAPWRWFIRSHEQRVMETRLDTKKVATFRQQLLWRMVSAQGKESLSSGLAVFMQAYRQAEVDGLESSFTVLRPAGAHLVNQITATPTHSIDPGRYQSFLMSSQRWLGSWGQAIESMLWLHHPTQPSALPGLKFIQDPKGAIAYVSGGTARQHFLVNLCLGVARQLMEEEKYAEAQVPMQFAKEHFADIVLSVRQPVVESSVWLRNKQRKEKERENLELLDQLALT
jgi:hypothetical protein